MSAYICSSETSYGMHKCVGLPRYKKGGRTCQLSVEEAKEGGREGCVNWNQYYNTCTTGPTNPFHGAVSFDNIGLAWVAIFLVISLEGWTDVMYFVQDSHSFWNWIYFVCLIVVLTSYLLALPSHSSLQDRVVLHDKSLPCRHRHTILGDEEERDGKDEGGEGKILLHLHPFNYQVKV